MDSDDFFDQGGGRPDEVNGRYRLPDPETGVERSWTRATTHAHLPEDSYALACWQLRQLLLGLRRRTDLLRLVESWADDPGRDDLDAVIEAAHQAAGSDKAANLGTAVHGVLQQVDRAWPYDGDGRLVNASRLVESSSWLASLEVPEWANPYVRGYLEELARQGLRPVPSMTERRVIHTALGAAGTLDNVYEEADGGLVLGDKKTGRADRHTERAFAIQLAVYQGAEYMLDPDGGPPVALRSLGLRRDYAVLVHVEPGSGACATYRVDLRRGRLGANLASDVREWRRERNLLLPYVPPAGTSAQPTEGGAPASAISAHRHLAAVPSVPPAVTGEPPFGPDVTDWPDPGNEHSANSTTAALGDLVVDNPVRDVVKVNGAPMATVDDLMKLSKAELQRVLRSLDPGATVAHQRKILAEKIVTLQGGGRVATTTPRPWDPAELPAGPIGDGEDPTDPRSGAFYRARMAEIAAAPSVAELGRIHGEVTYRGGDQAWTDAMTEAARARTAELDAAAVLDGAADVIEWGGVERPVDEVIAEVETSRDMAQVWNLATLGGSMPERWLPSRHERAQARLAAMEAAQKDIPGNPFGN